MPPRLHVRTPVALLGMVLIGVAAGALAALGPDRGPVVTSPSPEPASNRPGHEQPLPWAGVDWAPVIEGAFGATDPLLRVDGLIDGGPQLVAWGRIPQPRRNQFNDMGAVFLSTDGQRWSAVPVDHGVNAESTSTILGIAVGDGGLLAYGGVCCAGESAALWHSRDGRNWERQLLEGDNADGPVSLQRVAAFADGWIALGSTIDGSASRIWRSMDGRSWHLTLEVEAGAHHVAIGDLAVAGSHAIAVGTVVGEDGSFDGAVWRSDNGETWDRIGAQENALVGPGEVQLQGLAAHEAVVVATGVLGTAEERRTCEELLGMTASLAALPARSGVALSCSTGAPRWWVSRDGTTWEVLEEPPVAQRPTDLRVSAGIEGGLVVLAESTAPGSPDTTLFTTADARAWHELGVPPVMLTESPVGVALWGSRLIAITSRSTDGGPSWNVWIGDPQ
jgi:hypothetical protein